MPLYRSRSRGTAAHRPSGEAWQDGRRLGRTAILRRMRPFRTFSKCRASRPPAAPPATRSKTDGFVLIEVIIALIITLLALDLLFGATADALRTAHTTSVRDRALLWAEARLGAILDPSTALGEREGTETDGFRWRTRIWLIESAASPNPAQRGTWAHGTGLYAVSVTVFWEDGRGEQQLELDSAKLGPVGAPGS